MWGCVRAFFENLGTANARTRVWLTTSVVADLPIVDFTLNQSQMGTKNGIGGMFWDHYANANVNQVPAPKPIVQTTYRYEDNVHIRAGAPVSCAQIGFGAGSGSADTIGPATPSSLQIR
jgi:hypothetical protein